MKALIVKWIIDHYKSLTVKAKGLIVLAVGYAATMSVPQAKVWLSSNVGQHPKLVAWGTAVLTVVSVYQQPWVQTVLNGKVKLEASQPSPDSINVKVVQDPSGGTTSE